MLLCPIFLASSEFKTAEACECKKSYCAWWDTSRHKCAIVCFSAKETEDSTPESSEVMHRD